MNAYSTREAAKKMGISLTSLNRYIIAEKIPVPAVTKVGGVVVRLWSDADIERVQRILPTIKNGRTRHAKLKKGKPAPKRSKP